MELVEEGVAVVLEVREKGTKPGPVVVVEAPGVLDPVGKGKGTNPVARPVVVSRAAVEEGTGVVEDGMENGK